MTGIEAIAAERRRQIESEGWTPKHDDQYLEGELVQAAACYAGWAADAMKPNLYRSAWVTPNNWPWDDSWWKPGDGSREACVRSLEKAGALIAAEIDRLKRLQG